MLVQRVKRNNVLRAGTQAHHTAKLWRYMPMKKTLLVLLLVMWSAASSYADTMEFDFQGSAGEPYRSTSFNQKIEAKYKAKYNITLILVQTPSLDNADYLKQNKILDEIDAEQLQVIYVIACPKKEYSHGYHTTIDEAGKLMGESKAFKTKCDYATKKLY